ncbi:MAG: VanW family protein [Clostridia bacterium]|nr:VanW family protein [Clostridia bacterium]
MRGRDFCKVFEVIIIFVTIFFCSFLYVKIAKKETYHTYTSHTANIHPTTYKEVLDNTKIKFVFNNKTWHYVANKHTLKSNIFDKQFELTKYKRNGTKDERKKMIQRAIQSGISKQMAFDFMYSGLNEAIANIEQNIFKKATDASLKVKPKSEQIFFIKDEIVGVKLDLIKLYEMIYEQYQKNDTFVINVPVKYTYPKLTAKNLKEKTCFRGGFSTSIANSMAERKHNIYLSLQKINGLKVSAGETVSFNTIVGKRTEKNGYRKAKIIFDGEFVEGVGGGVCQVSTTLYNALLLSDLDVLEVHKHSQPISYVPVALDAMVNYGTSNLVFKNTTNSDIYIIVRHSSEQIKISIYGTPHEDGVSYKTISEIVQKTPAEAMETRIDTKGEYSDKVTYENESFVLKPARDGLVAKSYLCKYKNGILVQKKFLRQETYKPENGVRVFGAKKQIDIIDN